MAAVVAQQMNAMDQKIVGSNPARIWAFFSSLFFSIYVS